MLMHMLEHVQATIHVQARLDFKWLLKVPLTIMQAHLCPIDCRSCCCIMLQPSATAFTELSKQLITGKQSLTYIS